MALGALLYESRTLGAPVTVTTAVFVTGTESRLWLMMAVLVILVPSCNGLFTLTV